MDFSDNAEKLIQLLFETYSENFCLFYTQRVKKSAKIFKKNGVNIYKFSKFRFPIWGRILKTIPIVVIDNYYPEILCLNNSRVIQIWHATGAIKKFGWEDKGTLLRNKNDKIRFQQVYDKMTDFVVGSKTMGDIFCKSYNQVESKVRYIGTPRFDLYQCHNDRNVIIADYLYVPTYRENKKKMKDVLEIAISAFSQVKSKIFFIKLHPYINYRDFKLPQNIRIVDEPLPELFERISCVISDYSSSVFDFHIQYPKKKIVFFCPDFDDYQSRPGIQNSFLKNLHELIVLKDIDSFVDVLAQNEMMERNIYLDSWSQYNDGNVSRKVVELIKSGEEKSNGRC